MSTRNLPITLDAIDLTEAVEDAERDQAKVEAIAESFTAVAADFISFAEFVRANPHLTRHMRNTKPDDYGNRVLVYVHSAETIAEFARAAARAGRQVNKRVDGGSQSGDQFFAITVPFGWLELYVYAPRGEVCERVVTGTREVTEEIPDPAAPTITRTRVEEIVEYRCGPLLGRREVPDA